MKIISSILFFCGCATSLIVNADDAVKVKTPQQKTLSSDSGRFVFGQISDFRSDQYMVDTKTGKIWNIQERELQGGDGKPGATVRVLVPINYSSGFNNYSTDPN